MMQSNRPTSFEIYFNVGLDPDASEVAPLHRIGRDATAWPAGAIGHLRLARRQFSAIIRNARIGLQNRSMVKFGILSLV
jgi:hypothetical protein